jgi:hypothetical protein
MSHITIEKHVHAGQSKIVTVRATDLNGDVADPTTLTAVVTPPDGTADESYVYGTDDEWAKTSEGVYTFTYTPDSGNKFVPWRIEFTSETDGTPDISAVTVLELWVDP